MWHVYLVHPLLRRRLSNFARHEDEKVSCRGVDERELVMRTLTRNFMSCSYNIESCDGSWKAARCKVLGHDMSKKDQKSGRRRSNYCTLSEIDIQAPLYFDRGCPQIM